MPIPYLESVALLRTRVDLLGEALHAVDRPPRHDDEEMGPTLFRQGIESVSFAGLTLPGLFVGRCELRACSFRGTVLSLASLQWSDFIECEFAGADLTGADLRASRFIRCDFGGSVLRDADLRGAAFEACRLSDADLSGAAMVRERWWVRLTGGSGRSAGGALTAAQRRVVRWLPPAEPPGG